MALIFALGSYRAFKLIKLFLWWGWLLLEVVRLHHKIILFCVRTAILCPYFHPYCYSCLRRWYQCYIAKHTLCVFSQQYPSVTVYWSLAEYSLYHGTEVVGIFPIIPRRIYRLENLSCISPEQLWNARGYFCIVNTYSMKSLKFELRRLEFESFIFSLPFEPWFPNL